jgi:hypothetical protein
MRSRTADQCRTREWWAGCEVNLRGQSPRALRLVGVADEFLEAARWSLENSRLRVYRERISRR